MAAWQVAYCGLVPAGYLASLRVEAREQRWRAALDSGATTVLVALRAGAVVGFAACGPSRDADAPAQRGELYAIYLEPAAWSTGVGRALWEAARAELLAAGFTTVSLWVLAGNDRAIRFYERAGFRRDADAAQAVTLGGATLPEFRYLRTTADALSASG